MCYASFKDCQKWLKEIKKGKLKKVKEEIEGHLQIWYPEDEKKSPYSDGPIHERGVYICKVFSENNFIKNDTLLCIVYTKSSLSQAKKNAQNALYRRNIYSEISYIEYLQIPTHDLRLSIENIEIVNKMCNNFKKCLSKDEITFLD